MENQPPSTSTTQSVPEINVSSVPQEFPHIKKKRLNKCSSSTPRDKRSFLYRGSSHVIGFIEWICGLWGVMVASNPWKAIFISVLFAAISGSGLYYLKFEFRPYKLWVKEPSEFKEVHEWKMEKFPNTIRKHITIWEHDNVLTAAAINQMWIIHQEVERSRTPNGNIRYSDVCLKVPSLIPQSSASSVDDYDYYDYIERLKSNPDWVASEKDTKRLAKRSTVLSPTDPSSAMEDKAYDDYIGSLGPNDGNPLPALEDLYDTDYLNSPEQLMVLGETPSWLSSFNSNMNESIPQSSSHDLPHDDKNASRIERIDHCGFVEDLDLICYEESLLEVWGYKDDVIRNLTDKKVLEDINDFSNSRVTGFPINITSYLGSITRDRQGKIVSAKGALYTWYTMVNMTNIRECEKSMCNIEIDLGSGEVVDKKSMEWEIHLTNVVNKFKEQGMPVNLQASYLFGSVHRSALFRDIVWVCAGWGLLMVYVIVTLGKPFSSESRVIPVIVGIMCVGLSVMASYGICNVSGIPYGPLNTVLPILLIALGVDDMYVILTAWDSTDKDGDVTDVVVKTKKTLHRAGLAITVTSLTDVIAFIMGATTEVPALRYFCVYAAVGISVVYILQVTLFVAAVVLNQRSKNANRKSCLPCNQSKTEAKGNSMNDVLGKWMGLWVKFILKPPVTAFILLFTGYILGTAVSQALELQQRFESVWLLPKSSDIYKWFQTMDRIFPKDGREGFVFFENVKIPEELPELQKLSTDLKNNPYVSRVDAWFEKLLDFINKEDLFKDLPLTKELFDDALSYFLFNEDGAKYRNDIVFMNDTQLNCTTPVPPFTTFKISFQYIRIDLAVKGETQNAMNSVRDIVANANISGYRAPWALSYGQWETENVISIELMRNVVVVLVIVFVMTMILLASFRASLLVLTCVLATLADVAALMDYWGLTINTISCIALVLAIGICVDYAAHITHGFLVAQGSRKFRAEAALNHMGPAVLHGGISTLIAFLLLAPSDTFVFISYFKILTGVAVFGLYHAIVLLPVLLALLGPPPYPVSRDGSHSTDDAHSCTTESTNYPYTPNSITPALTPQSTTPNSPSSDRTRASVEQDDDSLKHNVSPSPELILQPGKYLSTANAQRFKERKNSSEIGPQALRNMSLTESGHKVNMFVKGSKERPHDDMEEIRNCSLVENPAIRKENILKLYIKNS